MQRYDIWEVRFGRWWVMVCHGAPLYAVFLMISTKTRKTALLGKGKKQKINLSAEEDMIKKILLDKGTNVPDAMSTRISLYASIQINSRTHIITIVPMAVLSSKIEKGSFFAKKAS